MISAWVPTIKTQIKILYPFKTFMSIHKLIIITISINYIIDYMYNNILKNKIIIFDENIIILLHTYDG